MVLINVKIVPVTSPTIDNGFIEFDKTIVTFGDMADYHGSDGIDARGAIVLPGFVDAHTHLGLCEDSLGFEGDDCNEMTDPCTPHLRAVDAVNALDLCFQEALAAGITCVATGPGSANPIAGQIAVIKTYGRCVDDMVVKAPAAMKLALGENPKTVYNEKKATPSTRMATAAIIREQLTKAREYAKKRADDKDADYDARLEALMPVVGGSLRVHIHAHRADDIFTALRLSREFGLDAAIVHCTQGHMIAEELSQNGVKAMCGPLLTDRSKPELRDSTPATPGVLCAAGVKTAIVTDHPVIPIQYLPLCASLAVREGMEYSRAIEAITIRPAEICGVEDRVGSIEVGKDADLLLFENDPLALNGKPKCVIADGSVVCGSLQSPGE